jgi:hypothetical protein
MLAACRLADLSALETYYARVRVRAIRLTARFASIAPEPTPQHSSARRRRTPHDHEAVALGSHQSTQPRERECSVRERAVSARSATTKPKRLRSGQAPRRWSTARGEARAREQPRSSPARAFAHRAAQPTRRQPGINAEAFQRTAIPVPEIGSLCAVVGLHRRGDLRGKPYAQGARRH